MHTRLVKNTEWDIVLSVPGTRDLYEKITYPVHLQNQTAF